MQYVEEAAKLWCEVLLQVVVLVDVDGVKSIGATRGFVRRTGVGDHDDPIGTFHAAVVDAEPIAFAPEALDDRVDHD